MTNKTMWLGLAVSFFTGTVAVAQNTESSSAAQSTFNLFEGIEVSESRPTTPNRPAQESRATTSEPIFTLVGTSRIGVQRSAVVRHQNGESIRVSTGTGGTGSIAGYEEYSIYDVGPGKLAVRYPSNIPCVEHKAKGVSCSATPNTALLELVNAEALARKEPILGAEAGNSNQELVDGEVAPGVNPFEALRAARAATGSLDQNNRADSRGGGNGRFTPRRIAPEDVPPGMRVVSTPFGDRLVEQ
jgi:hypothetical protein